MSRPPGLTLAEYASLHRVWGEQIVEAGGTWWRRVRPCFYRPVFPLQALDPRTVTVPTLAHIGGVQHRVPSGHAANSSMSFLVFPEAQNYSHDTLCGNRRYDLRRASRHFEVERPPDVDQFVRLGHAAYCSFFARTGYSYRADRVNLASFRAWAETLFDRPGVDIWCAYRHGIIHAVAVTVRVVDWLTYSTFFASTEALKLGVSDLMLHSVRQAAVRIAGIQSVLAARSGMDRGLDQFYIHRGAARITYPAHLRINPLAAFCLRSLAPNVYGRMSGSATLREEEV